VTRPKTSLRQATLLLALTSTGCSLKFVRPAPPRADWPSPVTSDSSQEGCTDLTALPVADTIAAVGFGTIGFLERNSGSRPIAVGLDLTAIPFLVSAGYGYFHTVRCHRYEEIFQQPQPRAEPGPGPAQVPRPAPPDRPAAGPPPHAN
jgi:hypothetical protein